jgi:hypothetical protein
MFDTEGTAQWIGFVGKIYTGNHRFSHYSYGAFRLNFFRLNQSIDLSNSWVYQVYQLYIKVINQKISPPSK